MNKFMVVLGLLLVIGLSFARPAWTQPVEGRYYCSFEYSDDMYEIAEDMDEQVEFTPEQCDLKHMYSYLYYYTQPLNMFYSLEDMYNAADCGPDIMEDPIPHFRAAMSSYNGVSTDFKAHFNQCVRSYSQEGGDMTALKDNLGMARDSYLSCVRNPDSICQLPPSPNQ
jgi:hypothetical protein